MFGDCAWDKATQHVWKIKTRITRQGLAIPKCCTAGEQDEDVF
jgi:hypothetical protein